MSLVKTLARVAAGVMLAKGIGAVMQNRNTSRGSARQTGGGILGDLLGNNTSGAGDRRSGSGGLGDVLGQVLGGGGAAGTGRRYGGPNSAGANGGLGGILDQVGGGGRQGARKAGGLGDILGGSAAAGGIGGILGTLLGGQSQADDTPQPANPQAGGLATGGLARKDSQPANDASFGELFNDSISTGAEPEVVPTPEQNAMAGLLLRAMIQAAKSDGKIDDAEKQRLLAELGELDEAERSFIREEMAKPVDAEALARDTPQGLGPQVYLMSLMAIDFDNEAEARYLHALAQALGLDQTQVNEIHGQVGVQNLYA